MPSRITSRGAWVCLVGGLAATLALAHRTAGEDPIDLPDAAAVLVATDPPAGAADLVDEAFDKFVTAADLGTAAENHDSARLTDAALLLLEGERVLKRPRKGVAADKFIRAILPIAALARDKDSLARLAAAAEQSPYKDLKADVENAAKLAAVPRKLAPVPAVSPDDITPDALAFYQQASAALRRLDAAPDPKAAEALDQDLQARTDLPPKLFDYLSSQVLIAKEVRRDVGDADDVLAKLSAGSRAAVETYTKTISFTYNSQKQLSSSTQDFFARVQFDGSELIDFSVAVSNSQHVKSATVDHTSSFTPDPRYTGKVGTKAQATGIFVRVKLQAGPVTDQYRGKYEAKLTYKIRKKSPPAGSVTVSFKNDQGAFSATVSLHGAGTVYTLKPGETRSITFSHVPGTTPFVRFFQAGGSLSDFTVANGGKYRIAIDPKTKLARNYFQ